VTATLSPAPNPVPERLTGRAGFRNDIQGLRALAVVLVLGYHAGVPQLSGGFVGVDVFFVISGFLITGLLLREIDTTGSVDLRSFYARRARRLLPATAVVLTATAVITAAVIPVTRWSSIVWDIASSAVYATNWRLAARSSDYLASDGAASPVQHFWTLAVEEQFYLVWPLLLLALVTLHRRTGWRLRQMLVVAIVILAITSLWWSVTLTSEAPGQAYFVTTTRIWELAIGAILAFGVSVASRLPMVVRAPLAVAGLAAIGFAALTFDASTPFPGAAALIPTMGAAAFIAAGTSATVPTIGRLLDNSPTRMVGSLSYSLYLWHWPLLVGARAVWADPGQPLAVPIGLVVVVASVLPAWLTYRFVEQPIHHAPVLVDSLKRNAGLAVACTAVVAIAAAGVGLAVPEATPMLAAGDEGAGAHALEDARGGDDSASPDGNPADDEVPTGESDPGLISDEIVDEADFEPDPIAALRDVARVNGESCIAGINGVDLESCEFGPAAAETTVAVVGDSKMHQWLPAIQAIAESRGWRVTTYLKSACALVRVPVGRDGSLYRDCAEYNEKRFEVLLDSRFDIILTSQRAPNAFMPEEPTAVGRQAMVDDLRRTWRDLSRTGARVTVVLDNAGPPMSVPDCVASNAEQLSVCAFPRAKAVGVGAAPVQLAALAGSDEVQLLSLQDWICLPSMCPAIVGNVLVYRQGSHLTGTYVASLTERFAVELDRTLAGE
jgi:peptidoglycan/LPS O-acetylase OafA/YrhL